MLNSKCGKRCRNVMQHTSELLLNLFRLATEYRICTRASSIANSFTHYFRLLSSDDVERISVETSGKHIKPFRSIWRANNFSLNSTSIRHT